MTGIVFQKPDGQKGCIIKTGNLIPRFFVSINDDFRWRLLMRFYYSLAFLLGAANWKIDHTPKELTESLGKLDQSKTTILDLGCGEGYDCISLAAEGWKVIGIDYVPLAIRRAKAAAEKAHLEEKTTFHVGDVSKLEQFNLPPIDFAYDIGCFHLLNAEQIQPYITGLADTVRKDGSFLLKAFTPRAKGKNTVGFDREAIEKLFNPYFKIEKTSDHSYWRFPARWYWMKRK